MELKAIDWIRVKDFMPPNRTPLIIKGEVLIKLPDKYECIRKSIDPACPIFGSHDAFVVMAFLDILTKGIDYVQDHMGQLFSMKKATLTEKIDSFWFSPKGCDINVDLRKKNLSNLKIDEDRRYGIIDITHWAKL